MPSSASFIVAAKPANPPPTTSTRCFAMLSSSSWSACSLVSVAMRCYAVTSVGHLPFQQFAGVFDSLFDDFCLVTLTVDIP